MNDDERQLLVQLIQLAKHEDLGAGDCTTRLLDRPEEKATFHLRSKSEGVLAGQSISSEILASYDAGVELTWASGLSDGSHLPPEPLLLATLRGRLDSILAVERVLLNFLQRLCGIAGLTREYVDTVAHTDAKIYDTRKTTPGWRALEKYAVRCGGGMNHRMGLFDAILIKDNHLTGVAPSRLAGTVFDLLNRISADKPKPAFVEVEVDHAAQFAALLDVVGVDVILLDNFSLDNLRTAVTLRDDRNLRGKIALEASGGISLGTAASIAETGVDRLSVGALTHSAAAVDLSLERVD